MKTRIVPFLALAGMLSPAAFALDLTPHQIVTPNDGPAVPRYFFQDEGKQLSFKIDSKMTITGGSEAAAFGFHDLVSGNMKLAKSPLPPGLALDDKNAETYRASARSFLPAQAADVQLEEEMVNPIAINGWTSQQYTFVYTVAGLAYRRSITFLNLTPQKQLVFDVSAAAAEYAKTYGRSYRVLNSISEMPAFANTGPT